MAGIYIHIPFCRQACHYCNFHFTTSIRRKNELIAAIVQETLLRKDYLSGETIESIYFGGGTPSLLSQKEIAEPLNFFYHHFDIKADAEITLEANPDDITSGKLQEWKQAGINRLSIGVQSFFEEDLQWMNRAHNARQAIESIQNALPVFNNITIDLIYGTPSLSDENWDTNMKTAFALQVPHLSCYALTVEPKTPLDKLIRHHKKEDTDSEKQSRHFLQLMNKTAAAGYEHYEISNFAQPGFRSRHNSSYWQGKSYLGLGPSAHSYNGHSRQWNISNNAVYIEALQKGHVPFEKEELTATQQLNEYIMTSLRTSEGISLAVIREILNTKLNNKSYDIINMAKKYLQSGKIIADNNCLRLTNEGKLFADGIAASLFL